MRTVARRSLAEEDRDLAVMVGTRLRAARHRAGLTQREVAEPRYTKAYISALENGLIKPSMAALRFLAGKLGTTPSDLLADTDSRWARIEAELRLAAGDWTAAADAFRALLSTEPKGRERGVLLLGLAEAICRAGAAQEAVGVASEARALLTAAGATEPARRATYWLASAHHQLDNPGQARLLLEELSREQLAEATPDPDFRVRTLVALAMVHSHEGHPRAAIPLLEEARATGVDMDDRRRGSLHLSLAIGYRTSGDMEAAIRSAQQGLALFRAAESDLEAASIENELALIYLGLGNVSQAGRHAAAARAGVEALRDEFFLANVDETEAQIALARGRTDEARGLAVAAAERAERVGNHKAWVSALLTAARAARAAGDVATATGILEDAATVARGGPASRLRDILTEWSEVLAESGDHARAYQLSREALELG